MTTKAHFFTEQWRLTGAGTRSSQLCYLLLAAPLSQPLRDFRRLMDDERLHQRACRHRVERWSSTSIRRIGFSFRVFLVALATQLPASTEKGRLGRAVGTRGGADGVHTSDLDLNRTENTKHKLGGEPKETCLRW